MPNVENQEGKFIWGAQLVALATAGGAGAFYGAGHPGESVVVAGLALMCSLAAMKESWRVFSYVDEQAGNRSILDRVKKVVLPHFIAQTVSTTTGAYAAWELVQHRSFDAIALMPAVGFGMAPAIIVADRSDRIRESVIDQVVRPIEGVRS